VLVAEAALAGGVPPVEGVVDAVLEVGVVPDELRVLLVAVVNGGAAAVEPLLAAVARGGPLVALGLALVDGVAAGVVSVVFACARAASEACLRAERCDADASRAREDEPPPPPRLEAMIAMATTARTVSAPTAMKRAGLFPGGPGGPDRRGAARWSSERRTGGLAHSSGGGSLPVGAAAPSRERGENGSVGGERASVGGSQASVGGSQASVGGSHASVGGAYSSVAGDDAPMECHSGSVRSRSDIRLQSSGPVRSTVAT
jgi:hypothetical protein